jgi:ribose transport system substrate-binding protein
MKRWLTGIIAAAMLAACNAGASPTGSPGDAGSPGAPSSTFDLSETTKGPNGEPSTPAADIAELTDEQVAAVKEKGYKIALLHAGTSTWFTAVENGIRAEAEKLGMEIVVVTDSQFDPAKQAADVETAMARDPDIIITLPVDPVSAAEAFRPAVDAGVKLLFVDNGIDGYEAGREYVSIVTGDHFGMGRAAADLMTQALGDGGKIGYIFHDADFYVTNNRDRYFKAVIEQEHPEFEIVEESGFTEEDAVEEISSAMITQHPDLNGIYVAWSAAATGTLAALRAASKPDVKVVSHDLDATNDLDMAQGGNLFGVAADRPYLEGETMVRLGALSLLGEETPPFVTVDVVTMTKDNIEEAYQESLGEAPPAEIVNALGD